MNYAEFLATKKHRAKTTGCEVNRDNFHPMLFPFQRDIVVWAARKGRAAVFADTGLGKTFIQLEWARLMGERALVVAPLSVARQTVREARKIDIDIGYVRGQEQVGDGQLWITNYEMASRFDFSEFGSVVLDESSILKAIGGKTRRLLTDLCRDVPYRLCCTATPAPNDYTELGNHVEFLGICSHAEMLAMFFVNANKEHTIHYDGAAYRRKGSNKGGQEWRLKHHAEEPFFRWLSSWSMALVKPSNLGYDDEGFDLPPLEIKPIFVESGYRPDDQLFFTHVKGIKHAAEIRRATAPKRLDALLNCVDGAGEQWIVWVGLDDESRLVADALDNAVEVKGSDDPDSKAAAFEGFQDGEHRVLVTKPRIGGFGMNFQNAHHMVFFGLNYSWEQYYQCIRRQWRYGQEQPVSVRLILSDVEMPIYREIQRKDAMAKRLREKLIEHIATYEREELGMEATTINGNDERETAQGENWMAMLGDSCERLRELDGDSMDLSVYSPPFADLYTYTDTERDLGNSRDWDEFFAHYAFIIREVLRVTKPGRLTCVHTSDIPAIQQKDGYIGVRDFPGEVIRAYEREGWVFVGRAFVQKNPQAQAIRTKSKALLFVQLGKDSADSRPALIDQILLFKKSGDNAVPVTPVENGEMDNEVWIEWAHGIWTGIRETETLQYSKARDADDEKHICPLQLETIERCVKLYSNPGEVILSPFMGIGSEGYVALRHRRRFIGIELKRSYFDVAVANLRDAQALGNTPTLFEHAGVEVPDQDRGKGQPHGP